MTTPSNESCQKCGDPLAGEIGYVEMKTASGEYQRLCFSCAIAQMDITNALTEIEMEEER